MANPVSSASSAASAAPLGSGRSYTGPFAIMTVLFFMWGFITALNDILIPRFKDAFTLTYFRAMLVQFAFFGAYFIGSLSYFLISMTSGDPIARIGYKNGIVIGLVTAAAGSALFWPAASAESYPLFLVALCVVGLGLAMLQIAANPYVTILGPERTASSRLNLAQGFNSLGTTLGPFIGGWLIFQYFSRAGVHGADSVKVPYLVFCLAFAALGVIFFFVRLPKLVDGGDASAASSASGGQGGAEDRAETSAVGGSAAALAFPHVRYGILAIFMYVGGEVSIGSSIISFLGQPEIAGLDKLEASKFVSLFWGGMLIGRFMGAVELSALAERHKRALLAVIPTVCFFILWGWQGWGVVRMYWPFLVLCWLLFQLGGGRAARSLMLFGLMVVALLAVAIAVGGPVAMWCVVAIGLFTSIGWSNIFSLAIEGVGIFKSQASSLLVMAVLGGALLPPVQGKLADVTHNLRFSFVVPLIAYAYVAFYGAKGHRIGRRESSS